MSLTFNVKGMVVVSNRLPFVLARNDQGKLRRKNSAGGLVTAVAPAVVNNDGIWVGWPGLRLADESIPEADTNDVSPTAGLKSEKVFPVNVDEDVFDSYYNGCCNAAMWPLFHSMPEKASFGQDHWRAYMDANELFAVNTFEALEFYTSFYETQEHVTIWVHDYHLLLAPKYIRDKVQTLTFGYKIAFFLHIPFPNWDIFRLLPWSKEVLEGMLESDLIGFHIRDYCANFLDCCVKGLGLKINQKASTVEYQDRTIKISPLPIGIPYKQFAEMAGIAEKKFPENETIVLGVDRLDYTKGLPYKFLAIESFLAKYPEYRGKFVFVQVAVPSRTDVKEYATLKAELDSLTGRINGRFSTPSWSPIRFIYNLIHQSDLAGLYRDAAVMLVTPLRDGMNLVAKEFCACQTKSPPGVLVVSPFAGAAEAMPDALMFNPYHHEEGADVIYQALTMDSSEKERRMKTLRKQVEEYDVQNWTNSFLCVMSSLKASQPKNPQRRTNPILEAKKGSIDEGAAEDGEKRASADEGTAEDGEKRASADEGIAPTEEGEGIEATETVTEIRPKSAISFADTMKENKE